MHNIDYNTVYEVENDGTYNTKYFRVTSFTNIDSLKANCELVFSNELLTKVVYPILLENDCTTFIEIEDQLYIVEHGTYVTGSGVDYSRAAVIKKEPIISL